MSEAGVAGYIASFPIPEVVRGINSFMLGAQSVNPDFKLKVVWVNTWFDPGKEADAAKALIDQGVDIITQHTDSTAPMQVAAERGIKAFGQASDMIEFGKETQLTSIIDNWGPYYIERVKAGHGRNLGVAGCLARHGRGQRRHGALHQHAGRREGDGRGNPGQDHQR
jgi:basic membrane protein A